METEGEIRECSGNTATHTVRKQLHHIAIQHITLYNTSNCLQGAADCHSLLKKYFTKEVMDQLKDKKTKLGATLLDVIQSGE